MMILMYLIPVFAWVAFIFVQHHHGDRPTSYHWWAVMTGIGMFEYGKGIFSQFHELPVLSMALAGAVASAGVILTIHARRVFAPAAELANEGYEADAH